MKPFLKSFLILLFVAPLLTQGAPFDQTHGAFDALLKQNVKEGLVNYTALKANPKSLDACLDLFASVSEADFNPWPEKDQIAFLINAYNAWTLRLILDHYPVKSIKDIGSWLNTPWDRPIVRLFSKTTTLNAIEHGMLRKNYRDPCIHFALVCAAKGCPPLRSEAYVGSRLDEQLNDQARIFLADRKKNRVEGQIVYLSPIFKWYGGDFAQKSGSVLNFARQYFPEDEAKELAQGDFKIKYTDYDWSLNGQ